MTLKHNTEKKWKLKFGEEIVENGVDEKMYHFYNRVEDFIEKTLLQSRKEWIEELKKYKCGKHKKLLSLLEESGEV
jgi:hypothetical protein